MGLLDTWSLRAWSCSGVPSAAAAAGEEGRVAIGVPEGGNRQRSQRPDRAARLPDPEFQPSKVSAPQGAKRLGTTRSANYF